jgi:hypothetical protein
MQVTVESVQNTEESLRQTRKKLREKQPAFYILQQASKKNVSAYTELACVCIL